MLRGKTLLFALLLLLVGAGCKAAEDKNNDPDPVDTNDKAQIYAAVIREVQQFARSSDVVYLVTKTDDLVYAEAPTAPSQTLPDNLRDAIKTELVDEPFELIWIESIDNAPIDPANGQIAQGQGILITLGNIHPQEDGSVLLSFFMACGDLCGMGKTFALYQYFNHWHITDSVGPVIAS